MVPMVILLEFYKLEESPPTQKAKELKQQKGNDRPQRLRRVDTSGSCRSQGRGRKEAQEPGNLFCGISCARLPAKQVGAPVPPKFGIGGIY